MFVIILFLASCKPGNLSLENKVLRICEFEQWHTFCGDTWTLAQAKVACRQLGRNTIGMMVNKQSHQIKRHCIVYGNLLQSTLGAKYILVSDKESTPTVNTYYKCNGRENSFQQCLENQFSDCDKTSLKAGLICGGTTKY